MKRTVCSILGAVLSALLLVSCSSSAGVQTKSRTMLDYFDTAITVTEPADGSGSFDEDYALCEEIFSNYHRFFDIYNEYPGTVNLCTVNRTAGDGPVKVPDEIIDLLLFGKEVFKLTGGRVNIAMGRVTSIWKEAGENGKVPTEEELSAAAAHTDIGSIVIDESDGTVFFSDPEVRIDVGAVAKGYATQKAGEAMIEKGNDVLISAGGNILALGTKRDGKAWTAGISDPLGKGDGFIMRLGLSDAATASSGNSLRYFEIDGIRYGHIIDTDTMAPADGYAQVTVIGPDAGMCDALSTAAFLMGDDEGMDFISGIEGYEAIWELHDGTVLETAGVGSFLA